MMMDYARKHKFFERLSELMSKCYLEDAQDPFLLIAETIFESRGINHLLKIKTLEEKIQLYESNMKNHDNSKAVDHKNMKAAYESFGKSMCESEVSVENRTIVPQNNVKKETLLKVTNSIIPTQTSNSNSDDPDVSNALYVCEDVTLHSPTIISNEILNLPIIINNETLVISDIVSQDVVGALIEEKIETISDKSQEVNEVASGNVCTDMNELFNAPTKKSILDAETLEIQNALEALHNHSADYDYDTFEPDYEDSE
ncbi:unnamed protein product [Diamesa serratosioi]